MASPLTTSPALEARKSAIDAQAANAVAASPEFMASLRLPPIPPSTPPLERKEIETRRKDLAGQLVTAASRGDEAEYRRVMGQLNPQATELTISASYGAARLAFFQKRQDLLRNECVASTTGTATEFWMRQLAHNTREISNMRGGGAVIVDLEIELDRMADMIPGKPGSADYNRRMEALLSGAVDAGYPARRVFELAWERFGDPNGEVAMRLFNRAIARARTLFAECAALYNQQDSPTAQIDFQKKFNEFRTMCGGLLRLDSDGNFDQGIFGQPAGHFDFLEELELHFRIAARHNSNP